ncbi:MAG: 3' terminal RNA ribose 2'-O-methyltransferase Hen1 [Clostridiaceae bacterium]|jgi:3' terminal RNA ribose 2'-O-methyltransferase Hen1|nr:3' terminal RNA ribose 2'-O-methyltransferase Hen1 [Clostridiaceae bacterium]
MLLTLTYRGNRATDLGYLLHKNPSRTQEFEMSFGRAYVFYPKAEETECSAALLIDLNPVDLVRGKVGSTEGGLFDYINDRPYVASSFMSTALSKVYSTAMSGRCNSRPELAASPLDLEASITMLTCRGDAELVHRVFEPLGYTVSFQSFVLDDKFPEWGNSDYVDLTIRGKVKLCDLLNHLYVLIPVFDKQKHYWMSEDEVEKLLRHGKGWLSSHPEMKLITRRYFNRKKSFANRVIEQLLDAEDIESAIEESSGEDEAILSEQETTELEATALKAKEKYISLNNQRLDAVVQAVRDCGAKSVVDLGCGEGRLLSRLIVENQITKLLGLDVSIFALERARERLHLDRIAEYKRDKVTLVQGSLTYRDKRIEGFDAACVVEVMEHMDIDRLPAFERVVFEFALPRTVIITTPNVEYNKNYERLSTDMMRHHDHRFEWTRAEFRAWSESICKRFGYSVSYTDIGDIDEEVGAPTQMGVFTKCE